VAWSAVSDEPPEQQTYRKRNRDIPSQHLQE